MFCLHFFLQRSFGYLFENDREELMQYSTQMVQTFLPEKGWSIHPELVLRFVANWVNYDLTNREECFPRFVFMHKSTFVRETNTCYNTRYIFQSFVLCQLEFNQSWICL